jgi:DNA polymerase III subunit epsilon
VDGMQEVAFAVVDVETTGLSPAFGDRVCEIAIVRLHGTSSPATFTSLVNPGRPLSQGAATVNGITPEMLATAPTFHDIVGEVGRHLEGGVFVAHNAPFDLGFLDAEFQRFRGPLPVTHVIDTLALARRYYTFARNSLGAIAEALNLSYPQRHRALQDAQVTWQVFAAFAHDLLGRGRATFADFLTPAAALLQPAAKEAVALPPLLREALANKLSVEIHYVTPGQAVSIRRIDPLAVAPNRDALYLRAYCHLRQDERTFRIDRIVEMRIVKDRTGS